MLNAHVLERIADGLGIVGARLGVSYGEDTRPAAKEVREATKRRILIAATMATTLHQATQPLAEPRHLPLLAAALAELHTEAGWACYNSGVDGKGHPNDTLKFFQLGQLCLCGAQHRKPTAAIPRADDPRLAILTS